MKDIGLKTTLQYNPYKDESQSKQTHPQLEDGSKLMPEVGVHCIGADILLPKGDEMARGHAVA